MTSARVKIKWPDLNYPSAESLASPIEDIDNPDLDRVCGVLNLSLLPEKAWLNAKSPPPPGGGRKLKQRGRLATEVLGEAVLIDEPASSSEGIVPGGARRLARLKRARLVATAAGAALCKCVPRGHSPGSVGGWEPGKAGLAVGGPQAVIDPAFVLIVVLEAGSVRDAVGVVPPANDLIPAEAAECRVLLLVRVRAELTEGAGDLDEVARRRYLVDVAVAVEHLPEEADSRVFARGGRDVAVIISTCAVGGADRVVVHADVWDNLKNLASSPRSKDAGGAHLGRSPGIGAPHPELGIAESSPKVEDK